MVAVPAKFRSWVRTAAAETGLPAAVVAAQINLESGFNTTATSHTGAQGIAQIEPGTWAGLGISGSPYNPNAALKGYTKLMRELLHQYHGNVRDALAAYNAGSGNIAAGYGYADSILAAAGHSKGTTAAVPAAPAAAGAGTAASAPSALSGLESSLGAVGMAGVVVVLGGIAVVAMALWAGGLGF